MQTDFYHGLLASPRRSARPAERVARPRWSGTTWLRCWPQVSRRGNRAASS